MNIEEPPSPEPGTLKHCEKGWFVFAFRWPSYSISYQSKAMIPDRDGCFWRDIWVGPFPTKHEAERFAP
jgi:hypothetical protein